MSATESFLQSIIDQFGKTRKEAEKVLKLYKKERIIKFDNYTGGYTLSHGAFWEIDVINNAINA